jgi:hypothetical protein
MLECPKAISTAILYQRKGENRRALAVQGRPLHVLLRKRGKIRAVFAGGNGEYVGRGRTDSAGTGGGR